MPSGRTSLTLGGVGVLESPPVWMHPCLRLHAFIPQRSEGPHSVSSRDNGVPSVTTVRITEHNRGSAAVMPVQGKQQEAVVVDSAVMKLALSG